jgi:hypothetical protein
VDLHVSAVERDAAGGGVDRDVHGPAARAGAGVDDPALREHVQVRDVGVAHDHQIGRVLAEQRAGGLGVGAARVAEAAVLEGDVPALEPLRQRAQAEPTQAPGEPCGGAGGGT